MVLRAISLAAVTILVWSTRPNPNATARLRTAWRTRTTSSACRTGMTSLAATINPVLRSVDQAAYERKALVDIERGPHPRKAEAELDQGDGDRRLHADHDGHRVEDARHRGDIVQHSPDEGIDDFERRDVYHHAARMGLYDLAREVVLQLDRELVMHVDPDADQKAIRDLENRNLLQCLFSGVASRAIDDGLADALQRQREGVSHRRLRDDVELHAEMDEGLGDLRADAADDAVRAHEARGRDRLEQMLRHHRVDRGHARDVDDRDLGARADDPLQEALHHHLGPRAIQGADQGKGEDSFPELHHRGGQLQHLLALPNDHRVAAPLRELRRVETQLVEQQRRRPDLARQLLGVVLELPAQKLEERFLEREHECRRLGGRRAMRRPLAGYLFQDISGGRPIRRSDVTELARLRGDAERVEKSSRLVRNRSWIELAAADGAVGALEFQPGLQQLPLMLGDEERKSGTGLFRWRHGLTRTLLL